MGIRNKNFQMEAIVLSMIELEIVWNRMGESNTQFLTYKMKCH